MANAKVTVTGTAPNQVLNFEIPQGPRGPQGIQGPQGIKGDAGAAGTQGIQGITGTPGIDANQPEVSPITSTLWATTGSQLVIPTHVSPAGGQTTHPSVLFFPEKWNGWEYWMAHTPYPAGDDAHEDPNLAVSHDGINWEAAPGVPAPLDNQAGSPGAYNSDVDLKLGPNNEMYIFWRTYDSTLSSLQEKLYYRKSSNGTTWTTKVLAYQTSETTRRLLSPTLWFENNRWTMWAIDIAPSPNVMVRLISNTATPSLDSGWSLPVICDIGAMQTGKEPWHPFIIKYGGYYHCILNDCTIDASGSNGDLLYMKSTDGLSWVNSVNPVIPRIKSGAHDRVYRATMVPAVSNGAVGFRVWYSAWTLSGPVWNVFRTFLSDTPMRQSGMFTASVTANGGALSRAVVFPMKHRQPPIVTVSTNSTRATVGVTSVTTAGFTYLANNWTSANTSGDAEFYWSAVENTGL